MRISDWSSDVFSSNLFKTLHDIPDHAFCKTKKGKGGFGRFHADPADGPIGNGGDQTQACGGDDTDRPFRADQQLLYVIAAVVLLERIQALMNTAVWQHRPNPFDKRSHAAMTQHLRSACTAFNEASDGGRSLCAQAERE